MTAYSGSMIPPEKNKVPKSQSGATAPQVDRPLRIIARSAITARAAMSTRPIQPK